MDQSHPVDEKLITGYSDLQTYLHIKDSPIQGKGLFSEVDIKKGTVLFEIVGQRIRHPYDPALSSQNPNWIGVGHEEWLMLGPGDIAIYLNHSCNPNVMINDKLELITMTPVKAKEELLLDYSTTELDPFWKMECNCGATECRKILRSFQFLPYDLQKKYGKYIAPVFTRTVEAVEMNRFHPDYSVPEK
jgi:hypothetical protein